METIKIHFVDMWEGFDPQKNFLTDILSRRYRVELSSKPDYIFYSGDSLFPLNRWQPYRYLHHRGIRIFITSEAIFPDFNFCDYALGCDLLDFGDRYFRLPEWFFYGQMVRDSQRKSHYGFFETGPLEELLAPVRDRHPAEDAPSAGDNPLFRRDFCSFVYSNPHAHPFRDSFFHLLSAYKPVASGGLHLNNTGRPVLDKIRFLRRFKFNLAFENACYRGYTTEKLTDAFIARSLPVYWGNPFVARDFNPKAFINAHDYETPGDLLNAVREADTDPVLYRQMLQTPPVDPAFLQKMGENLREFLYRIFDRPQEEAFRRGRGMVPDLLEARQKRFFRLHSRSRLLSKFLKALNPYFVIRRLLSELRYARGKSRQE